MVPPTSRVCVTGAGGFIASWIVRGLLDRGYAVHGTARDPARSGAHLKALPGAAERLHLFPADLLTPGSFRDAISGCSAVIHTASPYAIQVRDPQRELIDPAVNGTNDILRTCDDEDSVNRLVLTSSMAAITDEPENGRVLNEYDWNTKSTLKRNPYYLSKALAEGAAWQYVKDRRPQFDLVVINPFFVLGPSLSKELNETNKIFVDMLKGAYPGIMRLNWGMVDVRDVAESHIRALEVTDARGRYICANDAVAMRQVVNWMNELGYGAAPYKLPKLGLDSPAGDAIVKLASFFQPAGVGTYLRTHIGRTPRYDTSKIRNDLGLQFRDVRGTLRETLEDLKRWQHI
jgi:dihydroflavonol-4-reductase